MRSKFVITFVILLAAGSYSPMAEALQPEDNRQTRENGRRIYERACLWCHGAEGKGDGPSGWLIGRYSAPRPRDFTRESYKLRSTPSGELPTDQDLYQTVTRGIPGVMPPFSGLTDTERWEVLSYVKSLNPLFAAAVGDRSPHSITFPVPSYPDREAAINRGRVFYSRYGCQACHGDDGTGNGPESEAGNLRDGQGLRIVPRDLTDRRSLKNGSTPLDLYRSIMTGLDGTPMPSYVDQFAGREQDVWDLVLYLRSLSGDSTP